MPLYLSTARVKNCSRIDKLVCRLNNNSLSLSLPEWEDTGRARDSSAGRLGQVLHRAGGGLGVGAVAPVVDNHRAIGVQLGGAPGGGGVLVGALVILHTIIGEGEHTGGALQGAAGVRNPLGKLKVFLAWELEGVS